MQSLDDADLLLALEPPPQVEPARALIPKLKAADQDHEFYPTTDEIIRALVRDIKRVEEDRWRNKFNSVLDIGAGNGKVLMALKKETSLCDLHAIEKSSILCQSLDPEILVIGTDFHEQSLLSKNVDVIFCNPPYSEYEAWCEKIIRQAHAAVVYLVIPERWENSIKLKDAIKFRDAKVKKVGNFDFEDAEDRTARAKVHLLQLAIPQGDEHDPFNLFFKEHFADLINKFDDKEKGNLVDSDDEDDEDKPRKAPKERPFASLVVGPSYPEALVNLYRQEMDHIQHNYKLIGELDADLLREFEISPPRILKCLKARMSGLRNDYWHELFSRLNTVTDRLTSKSRKNLLGTLHKHVQVDFTVSNIYEIVIWVIKNANNYIDKQLIETYEVMVEKCNVHLYKSNKRTWADEKWRYCRDDDNDKPSHYALDYRIVTHRVGGVRSGYYSYQNGLQETGAEFLGDLMTVARNLGFQCVTNEPRLNRDGANKWKPNDKEEFFYQKDGGGVMLFDVRGFMNGNLHIRLNQDFILALNVEHGRLKGWIRTAREAVEELQEPKAAQYFNSNLRIAGSSVPLLAAKN